MLWRSIPTDDRYRLLAADLLAGVGCRSCRVRPALHALARWYHLELAEESAVLQRLHRLKGDRAGCWSISVSGKDRLVFRPQAGRPGTSKWWTIIRAAMGALMYDPPHPGEVVLDGCLGYVGIRRAGDWEQRLLVPVSTVILGSQDRLPLAELGRRPRGQQGPEQAF